MQPFTQTVNLLYAHSPRQLVRLILDHAGFSAGGNLALLCFDNTCTACLGGHVSLHRNTQQILPFVLTHALCSRCIRWFCCVLLRLCAPPGLPTLSLLVIPLVFATFLKSHSS